MADTIYSPLTKEQIQVLKINGCQAVSWDNVRAAEGFTPQAVINTRFEGCVNLNALEGALNGPDGVSRVAGIRHACLRDVNIGSGCVINNVHGILFGLNIGDGVLIEDVGSITCTGTSTFGNGHMISALNEGGGRRLPITAQTGAQAAYLGLMYRHDKALIDKLDAMAHDYANSARSQRASVGSGASITSSRSLVDVVVGPGARIHGITSLKNGTVCSSPSSPTLVRDDVIARDFIIQQGARVCEGVMLSGCLVGEGVRLGKQFSAENSIFLSNSEGYHSEAVSVFAGPYSVTHHRSTLLIAVYVSFFNAGSGTNQSNHAYKLGPLHQGILERGCKTGSSSYLFLPSAVGAFSAIMGKHTAHFDTRDLPFSLVMEDSGKSFLVPGHNLLASGVQRDIAKWPQRDRRAGSGGMDIINFRALSPFTAQKLILGGQILSDLKAQPGSTGDSVIYKGIHIKRAMIRRGAKNYTQALHKYFGDVILSRIGSSSISDLKKELKTLPQGENIPGKWVDVCGLLCPASRLQALIDKVKAGSVNTLSALHAGFKNIHDLYEADEWNWCLANFQEVFGYPMDPENTETWKSFIQSWKSASIKIIDMVITDASRDFDVNSHVAYGIDGSAGDDFQNVRGSLGDNAFIREMESQKARIEATAATLSTGRASS